MSGATIAATFQGSNPIYRNAQPGLVAKTLFAERIANPIVFIDEFDKVSSAESRSDPYSPFYTLLERHAAASFVDEFLQFPIRADAILWVMVANDAGPIPDAILDRLNIIDVPEINETQKRAIIISIYDEANQMNNGWFAESLDANVYPPLYDLSPRKIRIAIDNAMSAAGASNRKELRADDFHNAAVAKKCFGFLPRNH